MLVDGPVASSGCESPRRFSRLRIRNAPKKSNSAVTGSTPSHNHGRASSLRPSTGQSRYSEAETATRTHRSMSRRVLPRAAATTDANSDIDRFKPRLRFEPTEVTSTASSLLASRTRAVGPRLQRQKAPRLRTPVPIRARPSRRVVVPFGPWRTVGGGGEWTRHRFFGVRHGLVASREEASCCSLIALMPVAALRIG